MLRIIRQELGLIDELFNDSTYQSSLKTNIIENDNEYILEALLPGYKKEDIKIYVDEGSLVIEANKNKKDDEKDINYIRREIYDEKLKRVYKIGNINFDKLSAKLEDGILTINVPKEEKKYVEIK